jgi:GT2 family glycosyltransferase
MKTSVIVLTWNGTAHVEPCLNALLGQDPPASEVIVVDNASTDGTADLVARRFPSVQLIRNRRNLGFAAGNNVGLEAATGNLLVLLNQDTRVHPGFLAGLAAAFDDPTVGLAGCKLLYPDGTIQHAGAHVRGPRGETEHHGHLEPDDGRFDAKTDSEFVTGAALGISRQALAEIGPLDEAFAPAYYEDVDWCFRARNAGWRVVYVPEAVVTHYEGASADRSAYAHVLSVNRGRVRFLLKHWPLDRLLNEFGPAEEAWVAALPRSTWLMAARGAYLQVLLDMREILAFRSSSPPEAEALVGLLIDLRAVAMASLESDSREHPDLPIPSPSSGPSATAREQQEVQPGQQPPTRPSAGTRLAARVHRLWTGLRYIDVLPDLVEQVQQQGELIGWLSRRSDRLDVRSVEQARDIAQNIRELDALASRFVESQRAEHEED